MRHRGHSYRNGRHGRSLSARPGIGGPTNVAALQCSRCPHVGHVNLSAHLPPEQIDKKFQQAGWRLDPHVCVRCQSAEAKDRKAMTAKPSPNAMRAQAQMFTLLQNHFDVEAGAYSKDWDDQRIATDTGLFISLVTEFRRECFGEIREPHEIVTLRSDITSLETLVRETANTVTAEIASLRSKPGKIAAKWGA